MDDELLAGRNGTINTVDEIDYIIKDITKHQNKAFLFDRTQPDVWETMEDVTIPKGIENDILT